MVERKFTLAPFSFSAWLALLLLLAPLARADAPAAGAKPPQAAIASANALATDAGLEVLRAGGNAFDAAVAVSSTLGLVEPESSGLGGGAFMLLHVAKGDRDVFVDAREKAPLAATRDMYLDANGNADRRQTVNGPRAAAIPGLPAGLVHLATKYGRLPLSKSLAPAIRLAEQGWPFGAKNAAMIKGKVDALKLNPAAAALFLPNGEAPAVGATMKNPDYAATLRAIAKEGAKAYYTGEFAQRLVDGVRAAGGIWSLEDLAQYRVAERAPIRFDYRGFTMVTAPPPSSGGIALAEMLEVLAGYDLQKLDRVGRTHVLVESMRRAYRDRTIYLGDPDFVKVPLELLESPQYAAGLRAGINMQKATPSELLPGIDAAAERHDTSHFSVIDLDGNLVAQTQTVNLPYGDAFSVAGTGFLLNDEMDDFSVKPGVPNAFGLVGEDANAIAPGKRPLSSMTPTFLIGADRVAVVGSPGGSRIITRVLLGLLDLIDGRDATTAVSAPRFHHQYLPDKISIEKGAFSDDEIAALKARGFTVGEPESGWGNMQVVLWDRKARTVEAASDPRGMGVGKGATSAQEAIYK